MFSPTVIYYLFSDLSGNILIYQNTYQSKYVKQNCWVGSNGIHNFTIMYLCCHFILIKKNNHYKCFKFVKFANLNHLFI